MNENKSLELARSLVTALEDRKAENIVLLDVQEVLSFTDYFVICSGTSDRMLRALADVVHDHVHKESTLAVRIEGSADYGWVVVDCGDLVVHLFSPTQREYYQLEELWVKAKVIVKVQ